MIELDFKSEIHELWPNDRLYSLNDGNAQNEN